MITRMDVSTFFRRTAALIVAGKGGVGKTTVAAVLARAASMAGMNVLLLELEGSSGAARLLGLETSLSYSDTEVLSGAKGEGSVRARILTPDEALIEYLEDHGLGKLSRRLAATGALDVVATAVPGIKDILLLAKVKQLEKVDPADLLVLDAPAAGHALSFLTSAGGLADAARGGPIRAQASEVVDFLSDGRRCQVLLATLAEETPVNETVQTAAMLRERTPVTLAPVVANAVYPRLDGLAEALEGPLTGDELLDSALVQAGRFRLLRSSLQEEQLRRLERELPIPQLRLPYLFGPLRGRASIEELASALAKEIGAMADPGPGEAGDG